MSSFNEFFGGREVISFSEGWEVLSREHFTKEEALKIFSLDLGEEFIGSDLQELFVKFGPGEWGDYENKDEQFKWWIRNSYCKGAKKIWAIDMGNYRDRIKNI